MEKILTKIPYFSLKPSSLTVFERIESNYYSARQLESFKNLEHNVSDWNEISENSIKRLRKSIDYLLYLTNEKTILGKKIISKNVDLEITKNEGQKHEKAINYKLTFITLTLPSTQLHDDKTIKNKLLNTFLNDFRRKFNSDLYIWKSEKQLNGNIHFHIITNVFILHSKIRSSWNRVLENLGYITAYQLNRKEFFKNGFRMSENPFDKRTEEQQRKAYDRGVAEDWRNPNSTDIHSLRSIKNLQAYVTKYVVKSVTGDDIVKKMKTLKTEIINLKQKITEMEKEQLYLDPKMQAANSIVKILNEMEEKYILLVQEFDKLKAQGIEGKIWGCSKMLNEISNYVECCDWSNIPSLQDIVVSDCKVITKQIGNSDIKTFLINIDKYPLLKSKLDEHLKSTYWNNYSQ
jgi:hypothetical protein